MSYLLITLYLLSKKNFLTLGRGQQPYEPSDSLQHVFPLGQKLQPSGQTTLFPFKYNKLNLFDLNINF
jgi:hypothetical protein